MWKYNWINCLVGSARWFVQTSVLDKIVYNTEVWRNRVARRSAKGRRLSAIPNLRNVAMPLCGFVALWLRSYVAICLCGHVAMWPSGYVAMWLSGPLTSRHTDSHPCARPKEKKTKIKTRTDKKETKQNNINVGGWEGGGGKGRWGQDKKGKLNATCYHNLIWMIFIKSGIGKTLEGNKKTWKWNTTCDYNFTTIFRCGASQFTFGNQCRLRDHSVWCRGGNRNVEECWGVPWT